MRTATSYDIEALTFATAREAFDYCDGEHNGLGGDGVAIQYGMQNLAIRRSDARWLTERGERLVYLRKVALMKGDGDVVVGFTGGEPPARGAGTIGSPRSTQAPAQQTAN